MNRTSPFITLLRIVSVGLIVCGEGTNCNKPKQNADQDAKEYLLQVSGYDLRDVCPFRASRIK